MTYHKPKRVETNKLDFMDYYRIRQLAHATHQQLRYSIQQHDKDKITYKSAYQALNHILNNAKGYTSRVTQLNLTLINVLCDILVKKHVLSFNDKKHMIDITKHHV